MTSITHDPPRTRSIPPGGGSLRIAARMARSSVQADLDQAVTGTWDRLALEQVTDNLLSNALKKV